MRLMLPHAAPCHVLPLMKLHVSRRAVTRCRYVAMMLADVAAAAAAEDACRFAVDASLPPALILMLVFFTVRYYYFPPFADERDIIVDIVNMR